MDQVVEECKHLNELKQTISIGEAGGINEKASKNIIVNIASVIKEGKFSANEADIVFVDLFGDEGLLGFLEEILQFKKSFEDSKRDGCELIQLIFTKHAAPAKKFALSVKEFLWKIYRLDDAAKIRVSALAAFCQVLESLSSSGEDVAIVEKMNLGSVSKELTNELRRTSRMPATVKLQVMKLIGLISRYFSPAITEPIRLLRLFLDEVSREYSYSKGPDMTVIAGSLYGIHGILTSFSEIIAEKQDIKIQIFEVVDEMVLKGIDLPRREAPRAALGLFAECGDIFEAHVCRKYEKWFNALLLWTRHDNADDHRRGYEAIEKLTYLAARHIENLSRDKEKNMVLGMFKFFLDNFKNLLTGYTSYKDRRLAITGIGLFSGPVKTFLKPGETLTLFNLLIKHLEVVYFSGSELSYEDRAVLPIAVKSLGLIIFNVEEYQDYHIDNLKKFSVAMMDNYTQLFDKKIWCGKAVLITMYALSNKTGTLNDYAHAIIYQSLLRSLNHPLPAEVMVLKDSGIEEYIPTYKDYLQFWRDLTTSLLSTDKEILKYDAESRQSVHQVICSSLMKCSIELITKLDFSLEEANKEDADKEAGKIVPFYMEARKPSDHVLLSNLVDLLLDLLKNRDDINWLSDWILPLGRITIAESEKAPLVSGFYRLFALMLSFIEKQGIYQDTSSKTVVLFVNYICTVAEKSADFRDEVLASALQAVLSIPSSWLSSIVGKMTSILKMCFSQGLSYPFLAEKALDALNQWSLVMEYNEFSNLMGKICICMEPYLRSQPPVVKQEEADAIGFRVAHGVRRVHLKSNRSYSKMPDTSSRQWETIQLRILMLLTDYGSKVTSQLYDRPLEEISEKAIAWDQEEHLKFRVPFPDLKVTIFLDSLLPRVIELATSNSDRRVKLAACEVLHAFFVYMIGIGSERTEEYGRHHRLEKLYERTFPVVITLASDLDDVVRKIFQVLLGQTVRWFSKPISTENGPRLTNEADKILSCILDKLENVNPIIRNVAGEALCEFCTWNVKQTKPKDLSKPDIIKRILKNLYSLALHPSQTKRMGACTGWNATYREFREHQLLVEMFTFELLWHFMECLAKCDQDAKYSPTVLQAISAVRHLKRIVFEKSNLFLKPKKVVRAPPNFPPEPSLKDIMFWLFQHIARPEKEARRLTIELFFDFLPKISDTSGAAKFVKDEMAEGSLSKLISILESDLNLKHINDSVFMRALEASLEAYTSLFEAGVVNPDEILTDPASSLLEKIKFLVKKITSSLKVEIDNREEIFVKCSVLVQLLKFITALLQSNSSVTLSTIIENDEMFQLIKTLIFSPDTLGFHLLELTCHESLEQVKRALLASSSKNMPLNFFESFCSILEDGIDVSVEVNKVLSDETCSTQMIAGVSLFLETLEPKLRKGWKFYMDPTEILSMVIKAIKEKHKHAKNILWSSRQQKAFSSVVRLSTIMDLEVESAIRLLENEAANFWYDISTLIIPFLALGFSKKKEYFEKLVDLIGQCQGRVVESLMIEYINIVRDKQKADSDQVNFMMKHLSEKWSKLSSWASMDSEKSNFLVICLQKLPIDSNLFEWLTGLLCKRELNIEVKLQALSAMKQKNNLVEEEEKILAQSLNYLSALHFPLKTYDIKEEGSRAEFLRIFDQVLNTAIALSSNSMMRFLLQTVSGEHSHLRFAATKMAVNEMVQRASPDSQGCLIATFFDLVLHQNLNPETIRYVHELGEGVLIHSNFIKFKDGITSVIPEIVSKLEEVNMGSKEQITLKTICFQILTIVFTRLDKETINADINKAFCKSKNLDGLDSKAFLKKVVGVSDGTRSESLNIPSDCAEDYRKYHCAAYNCLIAIVTCTQTAEKFYVGYLYKEPKHIQATTFFEYLIVDDDIYFEDKNVGDLSKMKKYFVNLRLNSNHDESTSQNLRYLPSQTLVQSSLSEDFSRFDFSTSNLKERTHKLTKDRNTIELVQDPLNEHECMAQLVAVLLHMDDLELFKTPELPQSLKEIKEKLTNARVPLIVQVFLGKLIFNTSHIIERYSGEFLGPLLRVIARILGERKHFPPVARDLLALTLSWAPKNLPDPDSVVERTHVNKIIESLVEGSARSSSKSQKLLLEILRTVVEKWQQCSEFPMATILSLFKGSEDDKLWALYALDALLINKVQPINSVLRSDRAELNNKILECWRIKRRETLVASGEVCGELHRLVTEKQDKDDVDLAFLDSLKKLLTTVRREDKTEFIHLLYRMQIHSPTVLNEYVSQISAIIGSQYGDAKVWCIECLITGLEIMPDPWDEIGGQEIIALISIREPAIQEASLRLIQKLFGKLSHSRINELIKVVLNIDSFTLRSCRKEAYNFLIMAFEMFLNSTEANEYNGYEQTRIQIKNALLKGLLDSDDGIRNQLYNFWSKSPQLPESTISRALDIFDRCYSPTLESSFLLYSLKFLLDRTKDSPDYSALLFENPLSECTFKDLPLSSGRLTIVPGTLMPMFAQTMRLHTGQTMTTSTSLVPSMSLDSYGAGNAKLATQTQRQRQFEPTQIQGEGFSVTLPMDMAGKTLGTFILPESGSRSIFAKPDEGKLGPPRLRTYRNLNVNNRRKLSTTIESKREERRKEETEARKTKRFDRISVYRRYRVGELPDVQISYAALLTPLLALCQLDADLSRDVLVLLLKSIRQEDIPGFDSRASNIFMRTIKSSTEFFPHFIGTILEVTIAADGNISIPSSDVVDASIAAGTEMLGSLVMEKYLSKMSKSSIEPVKKKSRLHLVEEKRDALWIRMAKLSRHLGDVDSSDAILLEKLDFGEGAKEGLKAFNIGDFKKAADLFAAVSRQDYEGENYWIEYYHEALKSMGDWDQLEQSLPNKTDTTIWKHPSTLQEIFDCNTRLALSRRGFSAEFTDFVNEVVKDRNKAEILKSSVPGELAFLYAVEGNRSVSQLHFETSVKNFIFDWESTPVILPEARKSVIEKFIPSTDIYRFLERETFGLSRIRKIWVGDKASETDDILTRDKVFARRYYLLTDLKSIEDSSKEAVSSRLEVTFDFVNFALCRKNKYLAFKALEKASEYHEDPGYDVSLKAMYDLAYTRATLFRAVSEEPQRSIKWIIKGQEILDELSLSQLPSTILVDIYAEKANICCNLAKSLVTLLDSSVPLPSSYAGKLKEMFNVKHTWNKERIYSDLIKTGRDQMMQSVELVDKERKPKLILQFVKYCSDAIESSLLQEGVKREMLRDKVTGILSAMQHGLLDARKMFPSLLPLLEVNDWLGEEFMIKISDIPSWMFLSWDKQLFAWLPSKIQPWITPLVIRLCKDYPSVLVYGYNVSKESWNKNVNPKTHKEIERLLRSSDLQEKFLGALQHVGLPSVLAETFLAYAKRTGDFEKAYDLLKNTIFSDGCEARGILYREFTRKWKAKFTQTFENEMPTMSSISQLALDMKNETKRAPQKILLKDLSSWLSEYRRLGLSESIELPGQYGSGMKPMPEYHIYIESFEHEALILGSLRRPVKIGIVGSNAKSYKYLMKFGEDLRQDERIESLFEAANSTLDANPETRKRGMRIKTYKVFPLSPRHGLIEWMEGVVTMQDFFDLSEEDKAKVASASGKYSRLHKGPGDYIPGYSNLTEDDVESSYDEALRMCIPKNTMKRRFERLSSSPEGLYRLRLSFIRSHATMSIVHWILGIGDRHTSNNMVSVLTGESVGIDFGYAFDVSVEFLPVPEVVPIRLTPQIAEVTEPIGILGIMKSSMVHTLNAIKEDNDVFLAVLDVFVKEPSIDWIELAKHAGDGNLHARAKESWFPLKKVKIAQDKLMNGLNPAHATLEALKNKGNFEAIKNHVLGSDSQRGRLKEHGLSTEEQVTCLIEQSTDKNLLGRMWVGWYPFL